MMTVFIFIKLHKLTHRHKQTHIKITAIKEH